MNPHRIQRIDSVISGRAQDLPARLARTGLRSLEPVYRTIAGLRNRSWDIHTDRVCRVGVPVISIGNLTTGGTGKTPLVRHVTQWLLDRGLRPAIVSRGYGSQPGQPNDEFMELQWYLPDTPHIQNPDRVHAAATAIRDHGADIIVLDDGFQHRRIGRDLDLVLVDATCPFGYDHLLPRGLLREPVTSLSRADAVIITRADQVDPAEGDQIREKIAKHMDRNRIAEVRFPPGSPVDGQGRPATLTPGHRVLGFCGIGNPQGFQQALLSQKLNVVDFHRFPDHHEFTPDEIRGLQDKAIQVQADILICTVKDLVKIRHWPGGPRPLLAVTITTDFVSGEQKFQQLLSQMVTRRTAEKH